MQAGSVQTRSRTRAGGPRSARGTLLALLLATCLPLAAQVDDVSPLPQIVAQVDAGRFAEAEAAIAAALASPGLPEVQREAYAFERERMRRILLDFTLDRAAVEAALKREVPDLRPEEFAAWDRPNLLEQLRIDGQVRYFARAVPNLFRVHAGAAARRANPPPRRDGPMEHAHPHHAEVIAKGRADGSSAATRRVRARHSLIVAADAVPPGTVLRAWIPYPREIPGQQHDPVLRSSRPARHVLAPGDTLQRTVYLEQAATAGQPTTFSIEYELTVQARHHRIGAESGTAGAPSRVPAEELAERPPHVVFTPAMRAFSRRVVGQDTDPVRVARKLFAAVDAIPWGSAREYSTISNISDYALHQGHADCGQQTLLLITLLRLNGIPARWQSGMVFSDGDYDNLHDWGALWLAPHGWVPMDVTTGALESEDPAVRDFYFGSLDAYRIAFNDDWSREFVPPKRHARSETVDSQRGEVEWDGGNLYYDQWDYRFEAKVVADRL